MLKKNDRINLKIESCSSNGSGVGRYNGMAIFAPATVPGEEITAHILKVKKTYAFAKVESVIAPSPDRITPECLEVVNEIAAMECDVPIRVFEQKYPFMAFVKDLIEAAEGSHCILVPSDMALDLGMLPHMIEGAKKEPDTIFSASRWLKDCKFYDYGIVKKIINFFRFFFYFYCGCF